MLLERGHGAWKVLNTSPNTASLQEMAAMILILKNVLFLSLLFLDWLGQPGLLSVQFLTLLGCLDLLSHSVLKALASSEQDKEWGQAKLTPNGTPKVQRPLSLSWCLHFWPDRQRAHRQVQVSAQRQLPFAPRGDHGNWPGLLAGVHPRKNTFLIDGGSDGPWLRTDSFQAGTGILGGIQLLWLMIANTYRELICPSLCIISTLNMD